MRFLLYFVLQHNTITDIVRCENVEYVFLVYKEEKCFYCCLKYKMLVKRQDFYHNRCVFNVSEAKQVGIGV